jgi:hypothetical protein
MGVGVMMGAGAEHGRMATGVDHKCQQQLMMTPTPAMVLTTMTEDQGDVLFCFFQVDFVF